MSKEQIKIFITWASWFVWKPFLKKVLSKFVDAKIYVLINNSDIDFEDSRLEKINCSLKNISSLKDIIMNCHYFFHIAANATFGDKEDYDSINYIPTKDIVDILKQSKIIEDFIFISTIWVLDRNKKDNLKNLLNANSIPSPTSKYGASKLKAEKYILSSWIPYTIIRPTWIWWPDMRRKSHINEFISMIYKKSILAKCNFPWKVSLIHVEDLADILCNAIDNKNIINKVYIAETESMSIWEIFKIISEKIYKKDLKQIFIPRFQWFFSRIHHILPLVVNNLFVDYLCALDIWLKKDFNIKNYKKIKDNINEVIDTNINNSWYWIITWANSGIWLSLANLLIKKWEKLVLIDKETNNIDNIEWNKIIFKKDLSLENSIFEITERINKYKIKVLVNNVWIGFKWDYEKLNLEQIKLTLNVNIIANILITKALMDNLIRDWSIIVNIASSAWYFPLPWMSLYAASKAFVLSRSRSLWMELNGKCKVITFSPSWTNTNFQKIANVNKEDSGKWLLSPDFVAKKIYKSVIKNKSSFILLWWIKVQILMLVLKFLPSKITTYVQWILFKKMR